jgi:hypothetical protein
MHGLTAAALGTMWVWRWPWAVSVLVGSVLRMAGQMGYLLLSSFTMNENLFAVMVANVHNLMVGACGGCLRAPAGAGCITASGLSSPGLLCPRARRARGGSGHCGPRPADSQHPAPPPPPSSTQDRLSASIGASGAPSDLAIVCMIFALLLVNAVCYNFLMHVIGHIALRWGGAVGG